MAKPMRITKTAKDTPAKAPAGKSPPKGKRPDLVVMIGIGKPKKGKK